MRKKYLFSFLVFLLFLYLLCFPQEAPAAVRRGLVLWYRSVLPILFPFMILSGLTVKFGLIEQIPHRLLSPVCHMLHCSAAGSFAVVTGFLCGFPMGAKVTHDLHVQHRISGQEADFLYGFANNVSPAFLVSFLADEQLGRPGYGIFFLFCVLGASLLYALAVRPPQSFAGQQDESFSAAVPVSFREIDACIQDAVSNTVRLGAYITVFSLLTAAAGHIFPPGSITGRILAGSLEVTNGIPSVLAWNLPWHLTTPLLCAVCAFGGFSAFAQTVSIASMDRKTACGYLKSRVIITLLAVLLAAGILFLGRTAGFFF